MSDERVLIHRYPSVKVMLMERAFSSSPLRDKHGFWSHFGPLQLSALVGSEVLHQALHKALLKAERNKDAGLALRDDEDLLALTTADAENVGVCCARQLLIAQTTRVLEEVLRDYYRSNPDGSKELGKFVADIRSTSLNLWEARRSLLPDDASVFDVVVARADAALHFTSTFAWRNSLLTATAGGLVDVAFVCTAWVARGKAKALPSSADSTGAVPAPSSRRIENLLAHTENYGLASSISLVVMSRAAMALGNTVVQGIGAFIAPGVLPAALSVFVHLLGFEIPFP